MSAFFSSDGSFSLQFAIIFVVIFLILAGGVFLLRRFTGRGTDAASRTGLRGRQPRLGIVDIYELDRQRQLILLRRDNVEHLLLVGGPNDVVVERNITRGINARLANEETAYDDGSEPIPVVAPVETTPFPEAPVQHLAEPFPPRPGPAPGFATPPVPYREPTFEMPVVVPAPVPGSDARPEPARPLDLSASRGAEDALDPAPEVAPAPMKDSPIARVFRRTPPPLANLVPAAVAERVRLPERAPEPAPEPTPPPPPVADASPPAPVVPPTVRGIDAAILSDMARQLEDALRRPASAVRPAVPVQATADAAPPPLEASAEPEAPVDADANPDFDAPGAETPQAVDPVAAGMAGAAQPANPPEAEPSVDDALFVDATSDESPPAAPTTEEPTLSEPVFVDAPEPAAPTVEAPVVHEIVADAPQVVGPPPVPAELDPPPFVAPEPAPVAAKPAASPNPFSVEEIEAEFARLLGRPLDRKQ